MFIKKEIKADNFIMWMTIQEDVHQVWTYNPKFHCRWSRRKCCLMYSHKLIRCKLSAALICALITFHSSALTTKNNQIWILGLTWKTWKCVELMVVEKRSILLVCCSSKSKSNIIAWRWIRGVSFIIGVIHLLRNALRGE